MKKHIFLTIFMSEKLKKREINNLFENFSRILLAKL